MPQVTCVAYFTVKLKVVFSAYKKNLQVTFILRWGYGAKMQKNVRDTFINYVCFSLVPQKCERTCFLSVFENSGARIEFLNSWYFQKEGYFFNHPCVFLPSCKFGSSFEYFTYMMMMSNRLLKNWNILERYTYMLKFEIAILDCSDIGTENITVIVI